MDSAPEFLNAAVLQGIAPMLTERTLPALGLTTAFALAAWGMRAVSAGGAGAGLLLTFIICLAAGPLAMLAVVTVFLLTFVATRLGYRQKQQIGVAERNDGREASQIFANLGAAALCAAPLAVYSNSTRALLIGTVAALAEAAADTVSSEIGQAFGGRALLITNLKPVPPGTNGGVTMVGTVAGVIAACVVAAVSVWVGLLYSTYFALVVVAATAGMIVDSILGAVVEKPGRLGNDSVNFGSSSFAAVCALGYWVLLNFGD